MANKVEQRLVVLPVDPNKTMDLTPVLQKLDFWGEGWTIQQVSLSPYGERNSHVLAAVILVRGVTKEIAVTW
jgi:hypothetical protein